MAQRDVQFKKIQAGDTDNTIVPATAGKQILVLAYALVCDAAVSVRFESGAGGTALTGPMAFAANGGISVAYSPVGHFRTSVGALLNLESSDDSANIAGHIAYRIV